MADCSDQICSSNFWETGRTSSRLTSQTRWNQTSHIWRLHLHDCPRPSVRTAKVGLPNQRISAQTARDQKWMLACTVCYSYLQSHVTKACSWCLDVQNIPIAWPPYSPDRPLSVSVSANQQQLHTVIPQVTVSYRNNNECTWWQIPFGKRSTL